MAFLRKHKRSPFWYIVRRNLDSGMWEESSTGLRLNDPAGTRKAQRLADKYSVEEKRVGNTSGNPAFVSWVPGYIATHWNTKAADSRRRYGTAWQAIREFLQAEGITYPRQIRYGHGEAYLKWRKATPVHNRKVGHNTALLELKFLSQLINEAIKREFCESNPIAKLGIGRTSQKIKPELTDEEVSKLRAALSDQPEWMQTAFLISLYTGCRFSECSIPMEDIDLTAGTMRLRDAKRNENNPRKYFTIPINPKLRPLFERLKRNGATVTCDLTRDKNGRINYFFKQCGVDASFHSLRVTFASRLARSGYPISKAMRLLNHSTQLIHRLYQRLQPEDVRDVFDVLKFPD